LFINKVVLYGRLFYLQIAANLPDWKERSDPLKFSHAKSDYLTRLNNVERYIIAQYSIVGSGVR
jgi:hypothetical protein